MASLTASKVVLGLAYYGRSFTLEDPKCNYPGCRYKSGGKPGGCSDIAGTLTNCEISETIREYRLTPKLDPVAAVKMITWHDQWVAYDDDETFKQKVTFAKSQCLGGTMVYNSLPIIRPRSARFIWLMVLRVLVFRGLSM